MNTLVIDASTSIELIAVSRDGIVSDKTAGVGVSHSITLFSHLDSALGELSISIKEIDLIGVGIGPGSFTGIRIAVSTARMLAQLLGAPLVGVHSQLLYAVSTPASCGDYMLAAFDARKGRVFGALYRATSRPLEPEVVLSPGDYPLERLMEQVPDNETLYLIGDGISRHDGDRPRPPRHVFLDAFLPSGGNSCALVSLLYSRQPENYADFDGVVPFYARKSDAEVLRDLKRAPSDGGS